MDKKWPDLTGKIVFFEKINSDGSVSYDGGERLVVRETAAAWYAIKLGGGYDSHIMKTYAKLGKDKWHVLSAEDGRAEALALAEDLEAFERESHVGKKHWVDSVYNGAKSVARQLRAMVQKMNEMSGDQEHVTLHVKHGQTITLIVE